MILQTVSRFSYRHKRARIVYDMFSCYATNRVKRSVSFGVAKFSPCDTSQDEHLLHPLLKIAAPELIQIRLKVPRQRESYALLHSHSRHTNRLRRTLVI